eukprot:TRINITY_DN1059_c0_g1_i1.p1 TRINITY_DN1059_c0_g1~~TRINITY_DN1059_c0_g1_i1.p1  ORF type:complete len:327 (-),score=21.10 TRINITY_DN1059_c0_g1_i1:1177-2157(-)
MAIMAKVSLLVVTLLVSAYAVKGATTVTPIYVRLSDYQRMSSIKGGFSKASSVFATWQKTTPCAAWNGVTCDKDGYVTSIVLRNAGTFSGALSSQVTALTKLVNLTLVGNSITGKIPDAIGQLTSLVTLDLSYNFITGSIPDSVKNLRKCSTIILSYNQLTGIIPTGIAPGRVLATLKLDHNQLVGTIPTQLSSHYASKLPLYTLDLSSNLLTGAFSIRYMGRYISLNISNNYLSGSVSVMKTLGHHCPKSDFGHNCLSKKFVKSSCTVEKEQKTKRACASFCNATFANGGACRAGVCYPPTTEKSKPYCKCKSGKSNKLNKYTCK